MPDLSVCNAPTCAVTVEGTLAACPKCGGPMRAVREARWRGWVLLILGVFLALFMGGITWSLMPSLARPGEAVDGGSFAGTAEQARLVLYLFYAVIAFGAVTAANGLYQIVTGRQHWAFVLLTLLVLAGLILAVVLAMQGLK
ncbi:MAG TPA: hypothetical protein VN231_10045 [Allosphingosinicella sp.]|nr:hypothetical protein [Allosphingosinicella sp.]